MVEKNITSKQDRASCKVAKNNRKSGVNDVFFFFKQKTAYEILALTGVQTCALPILDAEPGYEDMPDGLHTLEGGYLDDWDARKALYWALFAGAHGHTYGCNDVWQMWRPGRQPLLGARRPWYEALQLPGAGHMQHARALLLSRPFLERVPDQSLVASEAGPGPYHVRATRDSAGRYALVYLPAGRPVDLELTTLSGTRLAGFWYDPRTGV